MAKKLIIGTDEIIVPEKSDISSQILAEGKGVPYGVTSGTSTAYTTTIPGISSYTDGMVVAIKFHTSNGEYPTLNINGLGPKSIYKNNVAPLIDSIITDDVYLLVYTGTGFKFTDRGGIPEAPDYEGLYLRSGFSETWEPVVKILTKADFGDVEIDPYDKTSLTQFIGGAGLSVGQIASYNGESFTIYADAQLNYRLVDILNQKQAILTNIFGMAFNDEDPKWVDLKDLGSIKNLGTFANSNDVINHVLINNLPTGIYKANLESAGGFEVIINYQRTLTTATGTIQSFGSWAVIDVDLSGVEPVFVRNDTFYINAETLPYDNSVSGLSATNVGQAIDELSSSLGDIIINADDIPFDGSGTNYLVSKPDVESAVKELDTIVDDIVGIAKHDIVLIPDTEFTITQAHFNKTLIITSSSNVTITVPTQIVENIEKGFYCDIVRYGTGEVTFSGTGIVLNSAGPLSIDAQYVAVSLIKIDNNNEWLLIGGRE